MILNIVFIPFVIIMLTYLLRHYIFTMVALYYHRGQPHPTPQSGTYQPTVSVLIPARNEERVIARILQRMIELTYPKDKLQIIVIDDASTDKTNEIADKYAEKCESMTVVHRYRNGGKGKSTALNEGLKYATGEIIYCFDADYYPQRDIIENLTTYFTDPRIGAVQGRVTVLNEPNTLVTRLVALERIGGYRIDQKARDDLQLIPQFGGTVGGFRRNLIESLGGWDPNMLAEDTDLTFRVYLAGYKIRYGNEAECYEEAVEGWRSYWHQRCRWAAGHMQCAFKHSWPLIRNKNLRLREKVDGFLLLNVYFIPIFVGLAWLLGAIMFLTQSLSGATLYWIPLSITVYSTTGNFAPFFEVGIGAYLDERKEACLLIPLLCLVFLYNMLICTKAFLDLCISKVSGNNQHKWVKTSHNGGISYRVNTLKDDDADA
ncbi:MAG: glycosyltransferase family 2 protein [Candidatus Bathyarchaeota archaeon]|nr:glycosyltransferase family 2 protein [Candidatus Bathyarchaeota archaeon]MDH5732602.1 glycosyltransferase family 2 protein [Candidatus Bathyarchaeota archaeon]